MTYEDHFVLLVFETSYGRRIPILIVLGHNIFPYVLHSMLNTNNRWARFLNMMKMSHWTFIDARDSDNNGLLFLTEQEGQGTINMAVSIESYDLYETTTAHFQSQYESFVIILAPSSYLLGVSSSNGLIHENDIPYMRNSTKISIRDLLCIYYIICKSQCCQTWTRTLLKTIEPFFRCPVL